MFSNKSTDDLLANLEDELTEVIELSSPRKIFQEIEIERELDFEKEISMDMESNPPIPAKRVSADSSNPVPARRSHLLDKREKNDENEIIQLSSLSSSSVSENHVKHSQDAIVVSSGKKPQPFASNIVEIHETESIAEEKFFVSKHGKWADDEKKIEIDETNVLEHPKKSTPVEVHKLKASHEIISEKTSKKNSKRHEIRSVGSLIVQTSLDSSSETSSSLEESSSSKKKSKKRKRKDVKKSKKKESSEDQASSSTGASSKEHEKPKLDSSQAIGIFVHSTGALKYNPVFKSLKLKVSLFNEDTGKQIGDSKLTKIGCFNNDFYNFVCTWNEMLVIDQDIKRLKEIYNNVLVFLELVSDELVVCWAFMKLFSPTFDNVNDKFQLQFFQHQKLNRGVLFTNFRRKKNQSELSVFDQWRIVERKSFPGVLNVSIKIMNQKHDFENDKVDEKNKLLSLENVNRRWQKLPGQACKIPNKIFQKTHFHEKGSMNVKFSHDGHLISFNEVTKNGSILHIQKFPEMEEVFTMLEHSDLIHDIDWLRLKQPINDCQWMLTCSSDFTAIIWKLETSSYTYSILPHPSFVYASKFLQTDDMSKQLRVVTAGRDSILRIWNSRVKGEAFELFQELKHPNINKSLYITAIATRNEQSFYTSSSSGDVVEWIQGNNKEYHLTRQFKLDEIKGCIVTCIELHPRGNKIFLRVQDFACNDNSNTIFIVGVPTGQVTQRHQQPAVAHESQGKLKITSCGSYLFSSNGSVIRFYNVANGVLTSSEKNFICQIKIPASEKFFSFDYHPKDFFFACSIYGPNGGVVVFKHEAATSEKDLFDKLKSDPNPFAQQSQVLKATSTHFSDIIRKLDEVFLTPIERNDSENRQEINENSFSNDSKRSRTYTVSQGPATYTIQRDQNNTYDIQRKDESEEDETTISESFN